jgi:hypothetical protein
MAAAVIEIGGLSATLALLAPFVVLLVVIVLLRRPPAPQAARTGAGMLRAMSPDMSPAMSPDGPAVPERTRERIEHPTVDWAASIRSAEAASDHGALAGLYLSFARAEMAEARNADAAEHLRSSVRAAAKSRNAAVQAEARLELAELARADGDLTTACEHWQIARGLFHELKQQASLDGTEQLMRKHGCPTDWVLNDF